MAIHQYLANEDDCYKDYEFYLNDHTDGFDWKAFVFFDKESKTWSEPTYYKSKSEGKIEPFDETEDAPPTEMVEWVKNFLEKQYERK